MFKVLLITIFLSFSPVTHAVDVHPDAPEGWVEMNSLHPVVLTWVKADPSKKLEEVPTVMVQSFPKNEKMKTFLEKYKSQTCFDVEGNGWNQTWCPKKEEVFVILSKGNASETKIRKDQLVSWVLSHD